MDIHSYIECTHNGITSWFLHILGHKRQVPIRAQWHILTGRFGGSPIKETISDFGTIETSGCSIALCQFHSGIDIGLEEVFSCH
jgi:hypothetical protein